LGKMPANYKQEWGGSPIEAGGKALGPPKKTNGVPISNKRKLNGHLGPGNGKVRKLPNTDAGRLGGGGGN